MLYGQLYGLLPLLFVPVTSIVPYVAIIFFKPQCDYESCRGFCLRRRLICQWRRCLPTSW